MSNQESDAIVFFGASGDLAYKQIFPSLLRLVRDEGINVPIVGVAKSAWTLDDLRNRAKARDDGITSSNQVKIQATMLADVAFRFASLSTANCESFGTQITIRPGLASDYLIAKYQIGAR